MVTNIREAKASLSKLVHLAAKGEDVVITVHGEPTVRLTSIQKDPDVIESREEWMAKLDKQAKEVHTGKSEDTPQSFWDELREDRF